MRSNYITTIYEDNKNLIWLGSGSTGVSYLNNNAQLFTHINTSSIDPISIKGNMIRNFLEIDERVYIATDGSGIQVWNRLTNNTATITMADGLPSDKIWVLEKQPDSPVIWMGTNVGLVSYHTKSRQIKHFPLDKTDIIVVDIEFVDDKTVWVSTIVRGLYEINIETAEINHFIHIPDQNSLQNNLVFNLKFDGKYTLYLATFGEGITYFDLEKRIFDQPEFNNESTLPSLKTIHLAFDKGNNLWAATSKGIALIDTSTHQSQQFTTAEGLSNNYIYSIEIDNSNRAWISSNKGLTLIDITRPGRERFRNFGIGEGLQNYEFNTNASYHLNDGSLLFGGVNGFNIFKPDDFTLNTDSSDVLISSISLNDKTTYYFGISDLKEITLPPNIQSISIELAIADYREPKTNQFAYRLEGLNDDFIYLANRRYINYANLKPGTYTLHLKAAGSNGVWRYYPHQLTIIVTPPFWQRIWFIVLVVMLLLGIALVYEYRNNQRKIQLELKVKERIERLRRNHELFKLITDNIADTIIVMETNGEITYVSPSLKRSLGYSENEIIAFKYRDIIHPDDYSKMEDDAIKLFREGGISTQIYRLRHLNGDYHFFRASSSVIDKSGETNQVRLLTVLHDITELIKYEEELKRSREEAIQANKAKSVFLAGMSHELRTPLNAILGFAQLLQSDREIPQSKKKHIDTMYRSGNHLLMMINDVLELSKIEAGKLELKEQDIDFYVVAYELESMFSLQAHKKGINFSLTIDDGTPRHIRVDVGKVQQILINLIGNAIKFTANGSVEIKISGHLQNGDTIISCQVIDTGIGISALEQTSIFDPFQQAGNSNYNGTGLGLSISHELADFLGGFLTVESEENKGSTFTVSFPVAITSPDNSQLYDTIKLSSRIAHHHNALVVDDIETNIEMLSSAMEQIGFVVYQALSGKDAIELLKSHEVDIILLDYLMPELNGQETMNIIRGEKLTKAPIIAVTAFGQEKRGTEFINMGFDDYIRKPIVFNELANVLSKYFPELSKEMGNYGIDKLTEDAKNIGRAMNIISTLEPEQRSQLIDAIDILDIDGIESALNSIDNKHEIQTLLGAALDSQNFKFIITLSDFLSKNRN